MSRQEAAQTSTNDLVCYEISVNGWGTLALWKNSREYVCPGRGVCLTCEWQAMLRLCLFCPSDRETLVCTGTLLFLGRLSII